MQFTIKTQEIFKSFSLRPIPSSSQDQSLLSRNASIEVLGCHVLYRCRDFGGLCHCQVGALIGWSGAECDKLHGGPQVGGQNYRPIILNALGSKRQHAPNCWAIPILAVSAILLPFASRGLAR